jgi:hypothetical protein
MCFGGRSVQEREASGAENGYDVLPGPPLKMGRVRPYQYRGEDDALLGANRCGPGSNCTKLIGEKSDDIRTGDQYSIPRWSVTLAGRIVLMLIGMQSS